MPVTTRLKALYDPHDCAGTAQTLVTKHPLNEKDRGSGITIYQHP